MKKILRQQDVTVANVLRCLNELNDENMVYVGTEPPEEVKEGLIWVNPEEITEEPEKIYVGHMVGDIYPVSYTELESGQLVLKGQLVSREIYGVLWAWLQKHPSLLITEQEYTEYLNSSENLCCPYLAQEQQKVTSDCLIITVYSLKQLMILLKLTNLKLINREI